MSGTTETPLLADLRRLGAAVERKQMPMAAAAAELVEAYKACGLDITLVGAERSLANWRNDGMSAWFGAEEMQR